MTLYVGKPTTTATNLLGSQAGVSLTGTASNLEVNQTLSVSPSLVQNHIYYFGVEVYQDNLTCSVDFYWPIAEPPIMSGVKASAVNTWQRIGSNNIRAAWSSGAYAARIDNNNNYTTGTIQYRKFILIDLTATYGSGTEPNVAWCNANIPFFEGTGKVPDPRSSATSVANKIKKLYVGTSTVQCTNLVADGDMENSSWSGGVYDTAEKAFGSRSQAFIAGNTRVMSNSLSAIPIVGHKYYGRHYLKTEGEVTVGDGRFEIYGGDGDGLNFVFGWNRGNYPTWTPVSSIVTVSAVNASSYVCRSFTVNATGKVWADGLMIVDLTATFGSGKEPTQAWCDENIPFFTGTIDVKNPNGSNPIARKIKKLYVGVAGIARKVFGEEPSYIGTTTPLNNARMLLGGASTTNYAVFAGGSNQDTYSTSGSVYSDVEAYSASLTKVTKTFTARRAHSALSFKGYALFGFGYLNTANSNNGTSSTERFDDSLTMFSKAGVVNAGFKSAAVNDNYAVFGGGRYGSGNITDSVGAFNSSFTWSSATKLSGTAYIGGGAKCGSYALLAGGRYAASAGYVREYVDAYDGSMTKSSVSDLTTARSSLVGLTIGNFAVFVGGVNASNTYGKFADAYNSSLSKMAISDMPIAKYAASATKIGDYAVVFGGQTDTVLSIDESLTWSTIGIAHSNRQGAAASVGDYALFAGGGNGTSPVDTVDIYGI